MEPDSLHLIAHRAGNRPNTVASALQHVDMIELDVHVFRGRVEVRHGKIIWPTSRLWEKWYLLPPDTPVYTLDTALAAIPPDVPILLDLKCFTRRAGRRIRRSVPEERTVFVSCRSWWVLSVFRDRRQTVRFRSCRSRLQLLLAKLVPGLGPELGVVAHQELLTPDVVSTVLEQTPHLLSWAVDTLERGRQLMNWGVTGLIIDDLALDWASLHIDRGTEPPVGW